MDFFFKKLLCIFIVFLLIVGCSPTPLEKALKLSGSNRQELEKVLDYFSSKEDYLKMKAAQYLIENMTGHYTFEGEILENYYNYIDSNFSKYSCYYRYYLKTIPLRDSEIPTKLDYKDDLQNISSDFLISHIDNMFKQKARIPWLREMKFEDFCEYVLPYRIDNEPMKLAKTFAYDKEFQIDDSILHYYDNLKYNVGMAMQYIVEKTESYCDADPFAKIIFNGEIMDFPLKCFENCFYAWQRCKVHYIPVAYDFIPFHANKNNGHAWLCAIDNKFHNSKLSSFQPERAARIYRYTYSRQPMPEPKNGEYVPWLFSSPFQRNVTSYYLPVSDIIVPLTRKRIIKNQYAYLSVFNNKQWEAIAFAKIKKDKVVFTEMGRGIVYLPVIYNNAAKPVAINYPFVLGLDGTVRVLEPNVSKFQNITITRKYPTSSHLISSDLNIIGGRIEASNSSDFQNCDTLATIESLSFLKYKELVIDTSKTYRYWRLKLADNNTVFISELEWWCNDNEICGNYLLRGTARDIELVSDKNPLSFSGINDWIGIDCMTPINISKIRYLLRNDANNIFEQSEYELFYFSLNGWISLGRKVADSSCLLFNNVPSNALFWLKNLNTGVEERIFTIENDGQIRFW